MWWLWLLLVPLGTFAAEPDPETAGSAGNWSWHADETLIGQEHGSFYSAHPDGANSFVSHAERSYSTVTGIELGHDLGPDAEAWTRIETIRGIPLSGAGGLAALTNNDMQRIMENRFVSYVALAFVTKYWSLGGDSVRLGADSHQMARDTSARRASVTVGKVDVLTLFDDNAYAHKDDDQFLNWCFMTSCAYDYAADARGYTWGIDGALDWDAWSTRAGWFAMPRLPNQLEIDGSIGQHFGVNWELERRWDSGALKFLAYQGRMKLSSYTQFAGQSGVFIQNAPKYDAKRGGAGFNLQQALTPEVGLFARTFWTGGNSESMAFTEADRSASAGLSLKGDLWGRAQDGVGIGFARNEINQARQNFLAAGNYDLFIGDGFLSYAPEAVLETYYRIGIVKGLQFTLDWQHIDNPAYNQERGPVDVYGIRLHAEF